MTQNHRQTLMEVGTKLDNPPQSKDSLLKLLKQAETCLAEIDQSPSKSLLGSMQSCVSAIAKADFLKHPDRDVKLLVAACICEIMRITAPEPPYNDEVLRDVFHLIVETFYGLGDISNPSFGRRVAILETLAKYRSCVIMLDLECNGLVNEMFHTFLSVTSNDLPEAVLMSMRTVMVLIIDESEDLQEDLLLVLLSALHQRESETSLAGQRLAMFIIEHCVGKLEPYVNQLLVSAISRNTRAQQLHFDHHEVIYDVYCCTPQILRGATPHLLEELLGDRPDIRLKSVDLLGRMFALPGRAISEVFRPLFLEFLKRLTDRVANIRISVVKHLKACLLSNPSRPEADEILSALSDRLLDYDESVREQVVAAVCDVARHTPQSAPIGTIKLVAERLRDKSITVKKYTLERLVELYRLQCLKCSDGLIDHDKYKWIPGKILRCFYDKDLRHDAMEVFLLDSLVPSEIPVKDKVRIWIAAFSEFKKVETKALEQALMQKQRLQKEMQRYLALQKKYQDSYPDDILRRTLGCIRMMSQSFTDPSIAEKSFQILNQLKDINIWKILTSLLDVNTSTAQASARDDLLKILGDRHPLFDFLGTLTTKYSYILFNKEFIREVLDEILHKSAGNEKFVSSFLNLLVTLSSFFPSIFTGAEEQLVILLKGDNETIKEGILHLLAKAGEAIKDHLPEFASSASHLLEKLCSEGTGRQAKYAVQALAGVAIDGHKSLSLLYEHLVDKLEKRTYLPAILQSLGYIAQTATPVYESREKEIIGFISSNIFECSVVEDISATEWDRRSEQCLLKIFAVKTLVKSCLPIKDAHLRSGVENLLEMLKSLLSLGEVSQNVQSSAVDKAHLRLASAKAILRLSRTWDHKIPINVFHMTLRISQDAYPQVRRSFLAKVYQYVKNGVIDAKYAIAFPFGMHVAEEENDKYKHCLVEIVEMLRCEAKSRRLSGSCGQNLSSDYPEYVLPYFIHALAHDGSFPNIYENPTVEAVSPIFWKLHAFLSVLVHQDERKLETVCKGAHDTVFPIVSIFRSVNFSEDAVDSTKSKNSHIVCDLGLAIIKNLCKLPDVECNQSFPLPSVLYSPVIREDDNVVHKACSFSWLVDDDLFGRLQSYKLQYKAGVRCASVKDEKIFEPTDSDETELPLKKMIKMLKSKRSKKGEIAISPASKERQNHEEDISSIAREVQSGNLDIDESLGVQELATDTTYMERQEVFYSKNKNVSMSPTEKISKTDKGTDWCGSNRKRKSSHKDLSTISDSLKPKRKSKNRLGIGSHDIVVSSEKPFDNGQDSSNYEGKCSVQNTELTNTATSHAQKKGTSKCKRKVSNLPSKGHTDVGGDAAYEKKERSLKDARKGGLELVGCRIKVWWPMDNQFYEGVVQSFDVKRKKYTVLYDDGDVETLRLEKEKWMRIDGVHMLKQPKLSNPCVSQEKLSGSTTDKTDHRMPQRKEGVIQKCSHQISQDDSQTSSKDGVADEPHASFEVVPETDYSCDDHTYRQGDINAEHEETVPPNPPSVEDLDRKACSDDSDDEPLNAWKLRASKAV